MRYEVVINKKAYKGMKELPQKESNIFALLLEDIAENGPVQPAYRNYSKIGKDKYHCHLSYRYVACWELKRNTIIVEVYYVGSRESAPY